LWRQKGNAENQKSRQKKSKMENNQKMECGLRTTMTYEEYVIFDKKCSAPANLEWKDIVIETPLTDLEYEINKMIERHHRLTCLVNYDRMWKRDKKFGVVDLIQKSHNVKMFPVEEVRLKRLEKVINELNIELKLLFNLRMKEIIK
jgi:hypothetical protein